MQGWVLPPVMALSELRALEEPAGIRAFIPKSKAKTSTHKCS